MDMLSIVCTDVDGGVKCNDNTCCQYFVQVWLGE